MMIKATLFLMTTVLGFTFCLQANELLLIEPAIKTETERLLVNIPIDFGGGCSVEKAAHMAQLIKNNHLKATLDIGVYRGRSFFPQALAHKLYTDGVVYGVDPYSNADAIQYDHPELQDALDRFAAYTNFAVLFSQVVSFQEAYGLTQNSILLRQRSDEAVIYFKTHNIEFDLIHIDGNHDTNVVLSDVQLYLPLLKPGGYLVLDDISWASVKPAVDFAMQHAEVLMSKQGVADDYMILQKHLEP